MSTLALKLLQLSVDGVAFYFVVVVVGWYFGVFDVVVVVEKQLLHWMWSKWTTTNLVVSFEVVEK